MDTRALNDSALRCISRTMRASRTQNEDLIDACRFLHENDQITDPMDLPDCPVKHFITRQWRDYRALDMTVRTPALGEIMTRLQHVEVSLFQLIMAATVIYPSMADELSTGNPFLSPQEEGVEDSELAGLLITTNQCIAGQFGGKIIRGVPYISRIAHFLGAIFELEGTGGNVLTDHNEFYPRSEWGISAPDRSFATSGRFLDNWRAFPLLLGGLSYAIFHAPATFFANGHSFPCCIGDALLTARAFRPIPPIPPSASHLYSRPTAAGEPPFYFRDALTGPTPTDPDFDASNPNEGPGELSA